MRKTHIIGLVIIACCIGIIISVMGNTSEYANFSTAAANPDDEYHVVGVWAKEQGLHYDPKTDPNYFAFPLRDDKGEVKTVVLRNNKPQDFERSEKVVVVGKMDGDKFEASSILMKCPSKYNEEVVKVKSLPQASR